MERLCEYRSDYESYLLRLWLDHADTAQGCRVMLQNVTTQEQHFFRDLTSLHTFLLGLVDLDRRDPDRGASDQELV